jgi:hypothetical protein
LWSYPGLPWPRRPRSSGPGHFPQLAHSRRYVGGTRTRSVAQSGPFIEGCAVYAEQVRADTASADCPSGFGADAPTTQSRSASS